MTHHDTSRFCIPFLPLASANPRTVSPRPRLSTAWTVQTTMHVAFGSTCKHEGSCKLAGNITYNYKPALNAVEKSPCTNVPMICPLCPSPRRGMKPAVVFKYSMEEHWRLEHKEDTITPAMQASVAISDDERKWLRKEWEKHLKRKHG